MQLPNQRAQTGRAAHRWTRARARARWAATASLLIASAGCRGNRSPNPPIHLQQNMDFQGRLDPQQRDLFWSDQRAMRPPVPNTVARGELHEDTHLVTGKVDGAYAKRLPMPLTPELLQRGQQRYAIYCSACHGQTGDGASVLKARKMRVPAPSYMEKRLREQPVGYFYEVVGKGVRNMPSYAARIPMADRWAIAAYVRALQIAGHASADMIPADVAAAKGWTGP